MLGKRSASLPLLLALLLSVLVSTPATAQTTEVPAEPGGTFAELSAADEFEKVLVAPGISQPMNMDIADDGRVYMTSRDGVIRVYDPNMGHAMVVGELDVFDDHPLPQNPDFEGSKNQEGGLLGLALDPDFATNGWVYVYYTTRAENAHYLSRFVVENDQLDVESEVVMLKVPYNKTHCCHVAGDVDFDSAGNLYLSTGDESPPDLNQQYSPLDSRPTHWYNDDRRTSGNTNDLRGKVLRITPQPDGTYTIPDGNLFTGEEDGGGKTRPEIFAMGFRNPFRISLDPATDRLHIGNYGPDRLGDWTERGPWGFDQYMATSEAANFGYPFCIGNNYPYRPWDYATNQPLGDFYDCENGPVNDSPNNTGLDQLPPVTPATIYYPRSWTGWPESWVGWPAQELNPIPEPFLNMGSGAGGPMSGPVYRYDPALQSDTKFPEHYDGRWFLLDFHRGHVKTADLDENEQVEAIDDFMPGQTWSGLMDGEFGPDGSLYVLEGGAFGNSPNAGLYRVDHVPDTGPGQCVTDDFAGTELDREAWPTIVRENPDGYRQTDGALEIDMLQGDMISNHLTGNINTTAQNLIMTPVPDGRWEATVTVDLPAESVSHDQAGFIIYADDQNFTKAAYFPPYGSAVDGRMEYLFHQNGEIRYQGGVDNPTITNAPRTLHLRLSGDGENVRAAYSRDGVTWVNVGRPAPISQYEAPQFGFFAAHGPNAIETPLTATFSDYSLCVPEEPACAAPQPDEGYRPLWDGATLTGWNQSGPGGFAVVPDGERAGSCALESVGDPAGLGMLWHEEEFESYRLHLDFKAVAEDDNSGVFFGFPDPGDDPYVAVRQGYEIQIDDTGGSPGAQDKSKTGSIYTFQAPTSFPTVAGEWNEMEIEVEDPMVRVWINDVLVNEYENPEGSGRDLASGFVGIQNNRVSDNVFFRDIWIKELGDTQCPEPQAPPAGFVPLYDGETLDGWTMAGPGGFEIDECGLLEPFGGMGLLWYDEKTFSDYVMRVDFRVQAPTDNSGVYVRFPDPQGDPTNTIDEGHEVQIYDGTDDPMTRTGAIYNYAPAESLATNPIGEWNTMEIEVIGQEYRVTLNGVEVTTFTSDGTRPLEGFVGLQNHSSGQAAGESVEFRNVWIKEIADELTVDATLAPPEPDGANGWYVSPVTLGLESNDPDAELFWRPRTDETEWRTWTEPVLFDTDGVYNIDYKAAIPGDGGEPVEKEILVGSGGFGFSETDFSVAQGDTVKFQYVPGYAHDVVITDENGEVLASRPLGDDWEDDPFFFDAADVGTYYVYCTPHSNRPDPDDPTTWAGMVATFEVTPSTGQPPVETGIEEIEFLIDQTAPTTTASLAGEQAGDVYTGPVTVTLGAQDATSGVAETQYRMADTEEPVAYTEPITVTEPGDHVVEFRSVDVAGHTEEWQTAEFTIGDGDPGACPEPDPRETVMIGDLDSGVPSYALDDGCTVNDLILDDGEWSSHGAFVRHAGEVTGQLVTDGVLTARERGAIVSTAARSDIGRPASSRTSWSMS
ncbi:family 16 glycoside hydrolase [Jiangella mangrovi]|uniref:Glucose/arabinose dehydrogenase/regulation of enolase protein 1 (Concanavalin A-like superfamily)/plastocyanin n=1 Tax=Jiangella mangrovi TaxID=1524084 RepID=A0A7W9GTP5_9ACTN|nr:family 16 glycoside hydrolase [Jiangella mangrovi]MBB5789556.1 glucose/arabinose dehydrogenase/regulation of enolase protein 1 (concanavalin A-like superfamily)/plastocyanin [Jiangella mangrovi]